MTGSMPEKCGALMKILSTTEDYSCEIIPYWV
jgi:hypothetical protein